MLNLPVLPSLLLAALPAAAPLASREYAVASRPLVLGGIEPALDGGYYVAATEAFGQSQPSRLHLLKVDATLDLQWLRRVDVTRPFATPLLSSVATPTGDLYLVGTDPETDDYLRPLLLEFGPAGELLERRRLESNWGFFAPDFSYMGDLRLRSNGNRLGVFNFIELGEHEFTGAVFEFDADYTTVQGRVFPPSPPDSVVLQAVAPAADGDAFAIALVRGADHLVRLDPALQIRWVARYAEASTPLGLFGPEEQVNGDLLVSASTSDAGRRRSWLLRLDREGKVLRTLRLSAPSSLSVGKARPTPDGGWILTGSAGELPRQEFALVKLDAAWNVEWAETLGPQRGQRLQVLPDATILVAAVRDRSVLLQPLDAAGRSTSPCQSSAPLAVTVDSPAVFDASVPAFWSQPDYPRAQVPLVPDPAPAPALQTDPCGCAHTLAAIDGVVAVRDGVDVVLSWPGQAAATGYDVWRVEAKADVPAARLGGTPAAVGVCAPAPATQCRDSSASAALSFYQLRALCDASTEGP